ncbi:hypothetical protein [Serratia bockelmannii]|uniref:hypothetical protein n=1 Tax=Serratia bockelmannii TaxID=2703793 RepID=UPI003FA775D9
MHDIYNALLNYELNKKSDDDLLEYKNTCTDATHGIFCALRLIGNLTVMANSNEEYDADNAKRDLFLLGAVLQHLPRMTEALQQNSESADFVLRKRKEVSK